MTQITIDLKEDDLYPPNLDTGIIITVETYNKLKNAYEKEKNKIQVGDWVSITEIGYNCFFKVKGIDEANGLLLMSDIEAQYMQKDDCTKLSPELQAALNKEIGE